MMHSVPPSCHRHGSTAGGKKHLPRALCHIPPSPWYHSWASNQSACHFFLHSAIAMAAQLEFTWVWRPLSRVRYCHSSSTAGSPIYVHWPAPKTRHHHHRTAGGRGRWLAGWLAGAYTPTPPQSKTGAAGAKGASERGL